MAKIYCCSDTSPCDDVFIKDNYLHGFFYDFCKNCLYFHIYNDYFDILPGDTIIYVGD